MEYSEYVKKYNYCCDVTAEDCYMGSLNCNNCAHCYPGNFIVKGNRDAMRCVCTKSLRQPKEVK